jgi:hypothetical protein
MLTSRVSHCSSQRSWFSWKSGLIGIFALTLLLATTATVLVFFHVQVGPAASLANNVGPGLTLPQQQSTPIPEQQQTRTSTGSGQLSDQQRTCANDPSDQHCTLQDPIAQGCVADAQTLKSVAIREGRIVIGQLDVRYSPACKSYWARTFSFVVGVAETDMLSPFTEGIVGPFSGGVAETYTDMAYMTTPVLMGIIHIGQVSISTGVVRI